MIEKLSSSFEIFVNFPIDIDTRSAHTTWTNTRFIQRSRRGSRCSIVTLSNRIKIPHNEGLKHTTRKQSTQGNTCCVKTSKRKEEHWLHRDFLSCGETNRDENRFWVVDHGWLVLGVVGCESCDIVSTLWFGGLNLHCPTTRIWWHANFREARMT